MRPRTYKPTGEPADEVITNAEWLYLLGELLDADLTLLATDDATDAVTAQRLATLLDQVMDRHADEICTHCIATIPKNLSPDNPACEGRWCSQATLSWLNAPCAEPDED